jgi:hypothetical protein
LRRLVLLSKDVELLMPFCVLREDGEQWLAIVDAPASAGVVSILFLYSIGLKRTSMETLLNFVY